MYRRNSPTHIMPPGYESSVRSSALLILFAPSPEPLSSSPEQVVFFSCGGLLPQLGYQCGSENKLSPSTL